ncbi:unnamed protein product [Bemisia tabaci]|uniref:Uncharacterized protein n=1 Tax=Bemisia tabaci TaxID=7038 RepID=A0A9P0A703_BEMTA|nr:unnamed protein product [Bemisia tabaci]
MEIEGKKIDICALGETNGKGAGNTMYTVCPKRIDDSVENGLVLECEHYEVKGVGSHSGCDAPHKARLNSYRLLWVMIFWDSNTEHVSRGLVLINN